MVIVHVVRVVLLWDMRSSENGRREVNRERSELLDVSAFGDILRRAFDSIVDGRHVGADDAREFRGRFADGRSAIHTETQRHQRTFIAKSRLGVRVGALHARQSLCREARDVAKLEV